MVKLSLLAVLLGLTAVQSDPTVSTHVSAGDIAATMEAAPDGRVSDQSIRMVDVGGYNVGIGLVRRPKSAPGGAIQHHNQTEIYHVIEGAGTLVTGGSLHEAQPLDPEGRTVQELTGPSSVGRIEGGESRRIAKGDMLIIPAGVPHGFTELEADSAYLLVRVDPEQLVRLK